MPLVGGLIATIVKRLRGPALVYLVANVLTRVGFIVLLPFYARRLTPEEYGDFVLAQSALGVAPVLALGLPAAISRFYFDLKNTEEARRRVGAVAAWLIVVTAVATTLALVGVLLFADRNAAGLVRRSTLALLVLALAGGVLASIPVQHLRDAQKPLAASFFQLAEFVLITSTGIVFVNVLGLGLRGAVLGLAITYLALGAVAIAFTVLFLKGKLDISVLREALRFSLPYSLHFLAIWLQGVADRWTLKGAGKGVDLGPYSAASQLSTPGSLLVTAWNLERSARTGEQYRVDGLPGVRRDLRALVGGYVIASVVPGIFIVASTPLLGLLLGPAFAKGLVYLPAFVLVNIIDALYLPFFQVVYYDGRSRWISATTTVGALASVALSVALIPPFGVAGALAARVGSSAFRTVWMWVGARRAFRAAAGRGSAALPFSQPTR